MRLSLFIFFTLQLGYKYKAQEVFTANGSDVYAYYDYAKHAFTVIDDSLSCYRYNSSTGKWNRFPLNLQIEESFARFMSIYIAVSAPNSNVYFVDKGCGQLYMLQNDTIRRIDKSNHHQNQFNGSYFIHNGKPFVFAGYGLFQVKNLLTHYEPEEGEWFSKDFKNQAIPEPRVYPFFLKNKDDLFILGGFTKNGAKTIFFKDVWHYSFYKNDWQFLGTMNFEYPNESVHLDRLNQEKYLCSADSVFSFDFYKNCLKVYAVQTDAKLKRIIEAGNKLLLIKRNSITQKFEFLVVERSDYLVNPASIRPIFIRKENPSTWNFVCWIVIGSILVGLAGYFIKYRLGNQKQRETYVLPNQVAAILDYFLVALPEGVEIASFNDFVNYDNPSLDTLKKRRENLLKEFKTVLSVQFNIPFDDVLREEKHPSDRRIKRLFINPIILDRIQNKSKGK